MNQADAPSNLTRPSPGIVLAGGILGMVVAMGIGRFAYTPILPAMQRDTGLGYLIAGQLASWNYLGYLAGALILALLPIILRSRFLYPTALAASCATTLAMGLTARVFAWGILRFAGGLASAMIFVTLSSMVIPRMNRLGRTHIASLLFSGIGFGIMLTAGTVPVLDWYFAWRGSWIGLGIIGCVASLVSWLFLKNVSHEQGSSELPDASRDKTGITMLTTAYFLEGLGYIVTATFLVAILRSSPDLSHWAVASWMVVGISAVPSTYYCRAAAVRFGWRRVSVLAYMSQACGLFLSVMSTGPVGILAASAIFGWTLMGITALTMAEGARRAGIHQTRVAAVLTTAFALGQMIGPAGAGWVAERTGGFHLPIILAGCCVTLGGVLVLLDRSAHTAQRRLDVAPGRFTGGAEREAID